jgi:hypothetical protein
MNEEFSLTTILVGALTVIYVGHELEKRRERLRQVFNVFDKEESVIGDALERLLKGGHLTPYQPHTTA